MKKTFLFLVIGFSLIVVGCEQNIEQNNSTTKVGNTATLNNIQNNKNIEQDININETKIMATQAIIKTNLGDITVKFYNDDASKTVENFVKLASEGFYDGIKFHRVIKDFMIQSGDPLTKDDSQKNRWGTGGPGYQFADEINSRKLVKGSLAMANSGPNTNGSQFFIVTADDTPWLDGKHTNFGEVVSGMDIVSQIEGVDTEGPDRPIDDVVIESIDLE